MDRPDDILTDRADEPSAFGWIMSGTLGAVVVGGLAKVLLDRRRDRAHAQAQAAEDEAGLAEAEGHPS